MRIDVTIDSVTSAYFLNGFSIIGNTEETLWGCNLGLIGEVGVTPDVVNKAITVGGFAKTVGGDIDGGTLRSGPANSALLVGGDIDGGTLTAGT